MRSVDIHVVRLVMKVLYILVYADELCAWNGVLVHNTYRLTSKSECNWEAGSTQKTAILLDKLKRLLYD